MNVHVDVHIASGVHASLSCGDILSWVQRTVASADQQAACQVSVRIVDAAEMQQLNNNFRGHDNATNVLSFPVGELPGLPQDAQLPLGDVVICASVTNDEAQQHRKSREDHWAHMVVHGTLHLLGFDHDNDADATAMEGREIQILGAHGITNPYAESASET